MFFHEGREGSLPLEAQDPALVDFELDLDELEDSILSYAIFTWDKCKRVLDESKDNDCYGARDCTVCHFACHLFVALAYSCVGAWYP